MDSFIIQPDILTALDDYHDKSLLMQKFFFEKDENFDVKNSEIEELVDDDLVFHVPIYDMLDRRYAAFSSFLEALDKKEDDPKGNGKYFTKCRSLKELGLKDFMMLCYLFRLCGSGINYNPNTTGSPFNTHGFGNFWVVEMMANGYDSYDCWLESLTNINRGFTNNKGYLLPQISYPNQSGGHLRRFILEEASDLIDVAMNLTENGTTIMELVDGMNKHLKEFGFKKQQFVLSAFAADVAEYYPELVDPKSMIYAGTNAQRCLKALFKRKIGTRQQTFENDAIAFLCDRYNSVPYSIEDSRLCDPVRYFQEYQSTMHINKNNGVRYQNNSVLKMIYSADEYKSFVEKISK